MLHTKKTAELIRELKAIDARTHAPGLAALRASGVPMNDLALKAKLAEVDGSLTDLRQEAGTKWNALQAAQQKVAKADGVPTEGDALYVELDETGRAYGALSDTIASTERVKQTIIDALIQSGQAPEGAKASGSEHERVTEQRERAARSAGDRVAASEQYAALRADPVLLNTKAQLGVRTLGEAWTRDETKAILTGGSDTSGGAFVQPDRVGYFPMPLRPLTILDLITLGQTDSDLVEYVKQTSFSNAAAPVAEATAASGTSGTAAMSDFDFSVVQTGVKDISHWVASTRRALADAGQLRTIIDGMLRYGLDTVLEGQVLGGDGVGENLTGILNTSGTNSVPAGPKSIADKVHFGLTELRLDFFEASAIGFNPLDWETVRLSRENTAGAGTGAYLHGSPSSQGVETLWGKPVVQSAAIPQGTAVVADWRAYLLWLREGTQVLASDSHADFFVRKLVAILASLRAAGGVPYPQAICEVNLAAA